MRNTANDELRSEMVDAHRLTALYGLDELSWNHISARTSSLEGSARFLITPGDRMYLDLEPEDLVEGSAASNQTGNVIHSAIYAARPDIGAIIHTHPPAGCAVACLRDGLVCHDQSSAPFHKSGGGVAYYDWQGISTDHDEGPAIAAAVSNGEMTLIMKNHGVCTFGKTVGEAWVRLFYLERACQLQLNLQGRRPDEVLLPDPGFMSTAGELVQGEYLPGKYEWPALRRWLRRRERERPNNRDQVLLPLVVGIALGIGLAVALRR